MKEQTIRRLRSFGVLAGFLFFTIGSFVTGIRAIIYDGSVWQFLAYLIMALFFVGGLLYENPLNIFKDDVEEVNNNE